MRDVLAGAQVVAGVVVVRLDGQRDVGVEPRDANVHRRRLRAHLASQVRYRPGDGEVADELVALLVGELDADLVVRVVDHDARPGRRRTPPAAPSVNANFR